MINLNNSLPAAATTDETRAFFALLNLVTDPKASAARVAELYKAATSATEAVAEAKAAQDKLTADRAAHDLALKTERAAHDTRLKNERLACERECQKAMDEVRQKTGEADRHHSQAKSNAEAVANLRADLERRLAIIKSAA